MTSTIASLLQLVAALLTGAQHNSSLSLAAQQAIVAAASQTVQLSTQAIAFAQGQINFAVPPNAGLWPTAADLAVAPYLAASGGYAPIGADVQLDNATISFGDLNGDGYDDAVVVVKRAATYNLAAMLNQGGIMFNIADTPVNGADAASGRIQNHAIVGGEFIADGNHYRLLGNQLIFAGSQ